MEGRKAFSSVSTTPLTTSTASQRHQTRKRSEQSYKQLSGGHNFLISRFIRTLPFSALFLSFTLTVFSNSTTKNV
jgi:hypothetical protein